MALDVARRRLPRGFLVNSDGAVAEKDTQTGRYYCNRRYAIRKSTKPCSVQTGMQCMGCISISGAHYAGIND